VAAFGGLGLGLVGGWWGGGEGDGAGGAGEEGSRLTVVIWDVTQV
jgi:hypothetical protein